MTENEAINDLKMTKYARIFVPSNEVLDMAIKALEKQIPKKPLYGTVNRDMACHCPICASFVCFADMSKSNYCDRCGQKLDFKDE